MSETLGRIAALLIGFSVALAGCDVFPSELTCARDSECVRQGVTGSCRMGGCAFLDTHCPSALRFDSTAPGGRGGDCVPDDMSGTDGGRTDSGSGMNACGGDTELDGEPGDACGRCELGTWQCDGPFAVVCIGEPGVSTNVTSMGLTDAPGGCDSVTQPLRAIDGDLSTSWIGPPAGGGMATRFDWLAVEDFCIASIVVNGNALNANPTYQTDHGFGRVEIQVLDARNNFVDGTALDLPGTPDPMVTFTPNVVGRTVRLLFTGPESGTCSGFSEIVVTAMR